MGLSHEHEMVVFDLSISSMRWSGVEPLFSSWTWVTSLLVNAV